MQGAVARRLADGRLHLNHGPIDLIIEAWGPGTDAGYRLAIQRFETVLDELVGELAILRAPLGDQPVQGAVASRMVKAVQAYKSVFVTPMAAVAGAVADEICAHLVAGGDIQKAYVNNGGDIAVFLSQGQELRAALHARGDAGRVTFRASDGARGLATSGWRGRSHSLGIADAVSVVGKNAAEADAAATLIANAVDLPGHGRITRERAVDLAPDSDLGEKLVTTGVGSLTHGEVERALAAGAQVAEIMLERGQILGAVLLLAGQMQQVGAAKSLAKIGSK